MQLAVTTFFDFAGTIAVLSLLAVPFGIVHERVGSARLREVLLGAMFGLTAAGAMLDPLVLAPGIIFDMRNLPLGLAGAYLGPAGALLATLGAAATRLWLGGAGVAPALAAMVLAAGAGLLWRAMSRRIALGPILGPLLLGTMISLHLLPIAGLPWEVMVRAVPLLVPIIVLLNMAGALVVGNLIAREGRNVDRRQVMVRESTLDPLTGIANRRGFERRTQHARTATARGNAVLVIDVDHFKRINDTLGHAAGDAVLRQLGARLEASLRDGDVLARFGGEEFVVYLADTTRAEAEIVAERLRRAIAAAGFRVGGSALPVTISVGARWQADPIGDWEASLGAADHALYAAKSLGRDRVMFAEPPAAVAA